eukprot:1160595_1
MDSNDNVILFVKSIVKSLLLKDRLYSRTIAYIAVEIENAPDNMILYLREIFKTSNIATLITTPMKLIVHPISIHMYSTGYFVVSIGGWIVSNVAAITIHINFS